MNSMVDCGCYSGQRLTSIAIHQSFFTEICHRPIKYGTVCQQPSVSLTVQTKYFQTLSNVWHSTKICFSSKSYAQMMLSSLFEYQLFPDTVFQFVFGQKWLVIWLVHFTLHSQIDTEWLHKFIEFYGFSLVSLVEGKTQCQKDNKYNLNGKPGK